jgi:hypothetical protein
MTPSFAFVREPETNGVAERFIRTLKEQIVFGRIYQNIEEVRAAAMRLQAAIRGDLKSRYSLCMKQRDPSSTV